MRVELAQAKAELSKIRINLVIAVIFYILALCVTSMLIINGYKGFVLFVSGVGVGVTMRRCLTVFKRYKNVNNMIFMIESLQLTSFDLHDLADRLREFAQLMSEAGEKLMSGEVSVDELKMFTDEDLSGYFDDSDDSDEYEDAYSAEDNDDDKEE